MSASDRDAADYGRPRCETCPYFKSWTSLGYPTTDCRRHTPDRWRATSKDAWCGEHPKFDHFVASFYMEAAKQQMSAELDDAIARVRATITPAPRRRKP
jgi:hypothetical protein